MTIEYAGRTFTVEETGSEAEPYRLVGCTREQFEAALQEALAVSA